MYYIIFIIIIITAIYFTINNMLNKKIKNKKPFLLSNNKNKIESIPNILNKKDIKKDKIINNKENFPCYGNDYCNGNKNNALCINQRCKPCGLVPQCKQDSDCGPNNCIDGCCDTL